jgi:hypothetical protein
MASRRDQGLAKDVPGDPQHPLQPRKVNGFAVRLGSGVRIDGPAPYCRRHHVSRLRINAHELPQDRHDGLIRFEPTAIECVADPQTDPKPATQL